MCITFVDANHPGSCHDAFIFNHSELNTHLTSNYENGQRNTWLLGKYYKIIKYFVFNYFCVR